jgi:excisionase family DNA binding protein
MTSSYNMTNTSHQPHVWTREDVAKNYQVSVRTVGEWIAYRRIPTIRIGRTVRFRPDAVAKALEKFEVKAVMK